MYIKTEVNSVGETTFNLKGKWLTGPVIESIHRLCKVYAFKANASLALDLNCAYGPHALITIKESTPELHASYLVNYIKDCLRPFIGRAFTEIAVNPYSNPLNGDTGGIDLIMMIVEETGCDVDYGSWNSCVTLKPTTSTQYNEIIELLQTFELKFN